MVKANKWWYTNSCSTECSLLKLAIESSQHHETNFKENISKLYFKNTEDYGGK